MALLYTVMTYYCVLSTEHNTSHIEDGKYMFVESMDKLQIAINCVW